MDSSDPFAQFSFDFDAAVMDFSTNPEESQEAVQKEDIYALEPFSDPKNPEDGIVDLGHAEEETLMECRCKAYFYREDINEWRERGVGLFSLLKNTKTGLVRLVMRRDNMFKICLNQFVQKDAEFANLNQDPKIWRWTALDHSYDDDPDFEGDGVEVFALRFKTEELAKKFHKLYIEAQKKLGTSDSSVQTPSTDTKAVEETAKTAAAETTTSSTSSSSSSKTPAATEAETK